MAKQTKIGRGSAWTLVAMCAANAAAVGVWAPAASAADTILEIYGPSLTSYLAGSSEGQDVQLQFPDRAVNVDGTLRAGPAFMWAVAGNPYPEEWNTHIRLGSMRLDRGAYSPNEIDLSLPALGIPWVVGRTYNGAQESGASHYDSDGPQGWNWFQSGQPEIVYYADGSSSANDVLYIVLGADRFLEFRRTGVGSSEYKGKNGAAGVVQYVAGSPDTYVYHDQHGNRLYFFGDNTSGGRADWQLWKMLDPVGNTTYVGDASSASTAASSGYNADQTIAVAYDAYESGGRRYSYTYATFGGRSRLTEVSVETKSGGTWASPSGLTEIARVAYTYYTADGDDHGMAGDLRLVSIRTALSDSGSDLDSLPYLERRKYYRYYDDTWDDQEGRRGSPHTIKLALGFEGVRRADWDLNGALDSDFVSESDADLKPYADAWFEYVSGSDDRISAAFFDGACGCGGGASGVHEFTYSDSTDRSTQLANASYDEEWSRRVVIAQPDGVFVTQYFDEVGQPLARVVTDGDPAVSYSNIWTTQVIRDASGGIDELRTPANATAYYHAAGGGHAAGEITSSASVGLVREYDRVASGDMTGFLEAEKHKEGASGTAYFESWMDYSGRVLDVSGDGVVRPVVDARRAYYGSATAYNTSSTYDETTFTYVWHSATDTSVAYIVPKKITTTHPVVSGAKNGDGTNPVVESRHYRPDNTLAYTESGAGRITYTRYENGRVVRTIRDPDDDGVGVAGFLALDDDPANFDGLTVSSDGWDVTSTSEHDSIGRLTATTATDGRVSASSYTRLADGRMVVVSSPRRTGSGTYAYYGPTSYTVTNHAGNTEFQGTIAVTSSGLTTPDWIDETDSDPILALTAGTLARMSTTLYDDTGGRAIESRGYFNIPASGVGVDGTNYDATTFGFDEMGRRWRVKDPTGTIMRTVFDELGRATQSWTGTNDYSFSDGEVSGPDNMVKVSETEFDGGSAGGNNLVTKSTAFVEDSTTDRRDTTYLHDYRGRAIVTLSPQAPYTVVKLDNLGRTVAVGRYSSTSGLDASDDPTSLATNRVGLSESYYDEQGRVWKTVSHKIDLTDGSDDDTIESLTWYDEDGRVVKTDGRQLTKAAFDRIGRPTRSYVLAKDNDSSYSDVMTVTGDHVMEETVTVYESQGSNNVVVRAVIARHHDDITAGTTGPLDLDADEETVITDSDIKGRIQITAMWYDALDRLTDTTHFGTNGMLGDGSPSGGTFTRSSSPAASSVSAPRATTAFNDDGTVYQVTDPRGIVSRFGYDDLGRRVLTIANYIDGTPSAVTGSDDLHTRWVFTDGLQTKMWVDLDGDDVEDGDDQVTTYTYGVAKGSNPDSRIASGRLLQKITYPDSTSGTDVVTFAYNAQGQTVYTKDQSGNVFETDYDTGGRQTHRRVSTLAGGFDGAVRRISTTYASHGPVSLVTQWDNATAGSGSVVNEVKYTYSDWPGMLKSLEQDRDSAVGAGSPNDYEVQYTYAKSTAGRNVVQRDIERIWHGSTQKHSTTYLYGLASSDLDDELSRVTRVKVGGVVVAHYDYAGLGQLVGIDYPEPDVFWEAYGSSTGSYPDLDALNRVVSATWTKDLSTDRDFYDVDYTYDENSNIVRQVDNIQLASTNRVFDAAYGVDNLNRLTSAVEGNWGGSSINVKSREQLWTLTQTGNWDLNQLSLNGDGDFVDADELDDRGTFNNANEWTARDIDDDSSDDYTLSYDAVGNLTDDGEDYEYEYDAFGRLRKLKKTTDQSLVAEYTYNGLGHRIGWHYDVDGDGTVENTSDDPWFYFAYDESWRLVATFRDTDSDPIEVFVHHNAGLDGLGRSSPLDALILRDKDADNSGGWDSDSDGVREERVYYVQIPGTRGDVVALITSTGAQAGQTRYSAYGLPFGLPAGDLDADGDVDAADSTSITSIIGVSGYRVLADLDLDGDVDATDSSMLSGYSGNALGRGTLALDPATSTQAGSGSRRAYAGYENDGAAQVLAHVRNRALHLELGRWTRRDPLDYRDGANLVAYLNNSPGTGTDALGLSRLTGSQAAGPRGGGAAAYFQCLNDCVLAFLGGGITGPQAQACLSSCNCLLTEWRCEDPSPIELPIPGDPPNNSPGQVPPVGQCAALEYRPLPIYEIEDPYTIVNDSNCPQGYSEGRYLFARKDGSETLVRICVKCSRQDCDLGYRETHNSIGLVTAPCCGISGDCRSF